jgi:transposase
LSPALRITELEQQNAQLSGQIAVVSTQFQALSADYADLKRQLDWFKRQLFGTKSEKQRDIDPAVQGNLLAALGVATPPPPQRVTTETVSYTRKKGRQGAVNETGLRFDDTVPVRIIALRDPAIEAIPASEREQIGEKVTHRLAQRPGSYEVLKYVRPVYKILATGKILSVPAPANVLEKCVADVSFLAGMLADKFLYHLPLYRQHQRLQAAGFQLSRGSLTHWAARAIDLLEPIYRAQCAHIRHSRVLAMDETPIKAGRQEKGKMRQAYFWPIYGEDNEIVFPYAASRAHSHVQTFLGEAFTGTLLSDGYDAYAAYASHNTEVTHAECWAHCRRGFEEAKEAEPAAVAEALALIAMLYRHEQAIRDKQLEGETKLAYRTEHSEPIVQIFRRWCDNQCHRPDLLPSNPLSKALKYARARHASLQVFLSNPEVPIDTNHLERALRTIPMGRRAWLFCWTELGAKHVGIIQSLIVTCRLQGVDVYTYLVDVLQRVSEHPAKDVIDLTPRVWKTKFSHNPMKSDLALAEQ